MFNLKSEIWLKQMAYFFQANKQCGGWKKESNVTFTDGTYGWQAFASLIAPLKLDEKSYGELVSANGESLPPDSFGDCTEVQIQQLCQAARKVCFHVLVPAKVHW